MLLLAVALDLKVQNAALTIRHAHFGIAEGASKDQKARRTGVDGPRSRLQEPALGGPSTLCSGERVSVNEKGTNWFWRSLYIGSRARPLNPQLAFGMLLEADRACFGRCFSPPTAHPHLGKFHPQQEGQRGVVSP